MQSAYARTPLAEYYAAKRIGAPPRREERHQHAAKRMATVNRVCRVSDAGDACAKRLTLMRTGLTRAKAALSMHADAVETMTATLIAN